MTGLGRKRKRNWLLAASLWPLLVVGPRNVTPTYDYLVTNDAEWAVVFGLADTRLAGKVVAIAPGVYSNKVLTNRPASTMRIVPFLPANPPELRNLVIESAKNIQLEDLKYTSASTTSIVRYRSLATNNKVENITFLRGEAVGSFLGVIDNPALDTTDPRLPYYACVVPVFTSGVLTGIQVSTVANSDGTSINLDYVGGLIPDGTGYSFTFQYAPSTGVTTGGVEWPGGAGTKPVATFDVVNGVMQGFNIVSGGSGAVNEGTATPANGSYTSGNAMSCIQWSGRSPMINMLPFAAFEIDSAGGISESTNQVIIGTLRYEGIQVRMVRNAFKHQAAEYQETVGCVVSKNYEDAYSFQIAEGNVEILHLNNHAQDCFSADGHPNDPHSDIQFQGFPNTTTGAAKRVSDINVTICGNSSLVSNSWGNSQGAVFIRMNYSQGTIPKVNGIIANNVVLGRKQANAVYVDQSGDLIVWRNLVRHSRPNGSESDIATTSMGVTVGAVARGVLVGKNIAEIYNSATGSGVWDVSSYPNATTNTMTPFAAFALATSRADMLSKIALTGTGQWTNANYGPLGGGFNFSATSAASAGGDAPTVALFTPLTGQALSSAVWSAWTPVLGIDGVVSVTAPGQYQIADDAAGTNATAAATSGSFTLDNTARKYIRLLINTSGSGRTATQASVTMNGTVSNATAVTTALVNYPTVTNGGTAWSRWDTVGSITGIAKGIVARRSRINTGSASVMLGGKSASNFQTNATTSPVEERFQLVNGSTHLARFAVRTNPINTWFDDIFQFDWTQNVNSVEKEKICKMVRNMTPVPLDSANSVFSTTGGLNTTMSTLFGTSAPQGLGVFANASGGNITNRQAEWVYVWFGNSAASMPDIYDPVIASKFSADSFGASGNAGGALPTPQLFFHAAANGPTEWNAGLANLGTQGGTLSKIAGTYA